MRRNDSNRTNRRPDAAGAPVGTPARLVALPRRRGGLHTRGYVCSASRSACCLRRRRLALRIGAAVDAATLAEEGSGDDPAERIADAVRRRVLALKD